MDPQRPNESHEFSLNPFAFMGQILPFLALILGGFIVYSAQSPALYLGFVAAFFVANIAFNKIQERSRESQFLRIELIKYGVNLVYISAIPLMFELSTPFWMLHVVTAFRVGFIFPKGVSRISALALLAIVPGITLAAAGLPAEQWLSSIVWLSVVGIFTHGATSFLRQDIVAKQEKIQEVGTKYEEIYNQSPEPRASVSPKDATIIECNLAYAKLVGKDQVDEVVGTKVWDYIHPEFADQAKRTFQDFQETGYLRDEEITYQTPDGRSVHCLLNANMIRDKDGNPLHSSSILTDITAQKQARDRLADNRFMEMIVDGLPLAMFCKDYKTNPGTFVGWNRTAESLWGLKKDQVMGKSDFNFFPKDQAEYFQGKDRETIEADQQLFIEEEFVDSPTVGRVSVRTWKVPIAGRYLLGISQDISAVKELERQLKKQESVAIEASKLASLGEMAGGIAHEINNPLAIISGNVSLMSKLHEKGKLDDKVFHDKMNVIRLTIKRIKSIVDGLRNFSRDGSTDPMYPANAIEVLNDALDFCRERFKSNGVKLDLEVPEGEVLIRCRKIQIAQVLINILNNARSAALDGPNPWTKVEVTADDSTTTIAISDSGPAIKDEVRDKLFQPFFTTKQAGEGTGLGLSISKGLIEDHQGKIYLDEDADCTRFVITLPIHTEKNRKAA